ncbi:UNVERIFIED_CONTAM: hypothetical protein GTU68_035513 [Idotea baltica]|nr:hypothetical protein [Idotea baltica]
MESCKAESALPNSKSQKPIGCRWKGCQTRWRSLSCARVLS